MNRTGYKIVFLLLTGGLIFLVLYLCNVQRSDIFTYRNKSQQGVRSFEASVKDLQHRPALQALTEIALKDSAFSRSGISESRLFNELDNAGIVLLIFKDDQLKFWSSNQVIPEYHGMPEGLSRQVLKNGEYLVIKRTTHAVCRLYLTEVRSLFDLQNNYLRNTFGRRFPLPEFIEIKDQPGVHSLPVYSSEKRYLFSVSINWQTYLKSGDFISALAWLILLGLFYTLLYLGLKILHTRKVACFILAVGVPAALRYLMLVNKWPQGLYSLELFSPFIYSSNLLFYSLGDFYLNIFLVLWLAVYLLRSARFLTAIYTRQVVSYAIPFFCMASLIGLLYLFDFLFRGLVENSNIPLDLVNILDLNYFSLLAVLLLGLLWLVFYLLLQFFYRMVLRTGLPERQLLVILLAGTVFFTLLQIILSGGFYYPALFSIMVVAVYIKEKKGASSIWGTETLIFILMIAFVTALKLSAFTTNKENVNRISFAEKLQKSSDPVSEFLLKDNEEKISQDSLFSSMLLQRQVSGRARLFRIANQHLQKDYFGRSFSGFELKTFLYDIHDQLISGENVYPLKAFISAAKSPKVRKVSNYFYQLEVSLPSYFGIIPVVSKGVETGTIVVWIVAKSIGENNTFPDLLMDGKTYFERRQQKYSYAYYKNGSLLDKFGKYPYGISSHEFIARGKMPEISYLESGGFNHLIYHPDSEGYIIVSRPSTTFFKQVAVFSYVMAFYLLEYVCLISLLYLINLSRRASSLSTLVTYFSKQRFLYKSRIQGSVIFGVLLSLFIIGWVTLYYIQNQYKNEQREFLSDKVDNLRKAFENEMPTDTLNRLNENTNLIFLSLATEQNSDLNFFDTNGDLLFTSLAKLYDRGLISPKMNPAAYAQMYVSGRTELVNDEHIGELNYLSVYAPVRNTSNQVVGYINFPYFANQNEIDQKLSGFVSTLINVYVFIFLLIGLFAFVLANSVTYPLVLIQENLRRIKIGTINEPLVWKRDDEIGDLIREYNSMVKALEESADKLARSERESAWREMARQVAHEIKNPLTPLKLGIQHLERAWKNNDLRFDEMFKKFSTTFIQQIDSLSAIATEFSNFAKMPAANPFEFDLNTIAENAVNLFNETEQVTVHLIRPEGMMFNVWADQDQLQRALNNLIKNAIQSFPEEKGASIEIRLTRNGQHAELEVIDTGQGIAPAIRDKIFTPNFTTKSSGMGLGLAFVRNAVENAGGSISFTSAEGEGTSFKMLIPLKLK